jgi:hypothetical protein
MGMKQWTLHAPQLFTSVLRLTQPPPQQVKAIWQTLPQAPQLFPSDLVSTQTPPQ